MRERLFLKPANRWFVYRGLHRIFCSAGDNGKRGDYVCLWLERKCLFHRCHTPLTDVDVLVCQTCRRADMPDQAVRLGAQLLEKLDNADLPAGVRVHGVDCLLNSGNGCTIVLQAATGWT